MIKAVLFDFDGVLTLDKTGTQSISNYICSQAGINITKFKECYYKYNNKLLYGQLEHKDIWEELCSEIGKEIEYSILEKSFINTPIDQEMLTLVEKLENNYKIAMVTDNKKDRIDSIVAYYDWHKLFDVISISAEVGSGKANEKIFIQTLEQLNVKADECVFIDNTKSNLVVPLKLGINIIYYNDEERKIERLRCELKSLQIEI